MQGLGALLERRELGARADDGDFLTAVTASGVARLAGRFEGARGRLQEFVADLVTVVEAIEPSVEASFVSKSSDAAASGSRS